MSFNPAKSKNNRFDRDRTDSRASSRHSSSNSTQHKHHHDDYSRSSISHSHSRCSQGSSKSDSSKQRTISIDKIERELGSRSCNIEDFEFFHGKLPREDCHQLLKEDGDFLVRESYDEREKMISIVLTVMSQGVHRNFRVQSDYKGYRFEGSSFKSIPELIAFHIITGQPVTDRTGSKLLYPVKREEWEIHADQIIELDTVLGKGHFGVVKKGVFYATQTDGKKKGHEVALKQCHDKLSPVEKNKFLLEARILKRYNHPNIVRFIGVCTWRDPFMIIMEFIAGGSLIEYLQNHRHRRETVKMATLVQFCLDAAVGMEYLASKDCIHRDLSARNCLLGGSDNLTIKISDFGMSREGSSYQVDADSKIPIKWSAPEAYNKGIYTMKSDVWSYGILLYEIFSHGMIPYGKMGNKEVVAKLNAGSRLNATAGTPDPFASLMQDCWKTEPNERPNFTQIKSICEAFFESRPGHRNDQINN